MMAPAKEEAPSLLLAPTLLHDDDAAALGLATGRFSKSSSSAGSETHWRSAQSDVSVKEPSEDEPWTSRNGCRVAAMLEIDYRCARRSLQAKEMGCERVLVGWESEVDVRRELATQTRSRSPGPARSYAAAKSSSRLRIGNDGCPGFELATMGAPASNWQRWVPRLVTIGKPAYQYPQPPTAVSTSFPLLNGSSRAATLT
ncbi:unnamed protein product [Phaeothamnion confervicola]